MFLSTLDLKGLKKSGWTVGCHSSSHTDFSKLDSKQIKWEVVNSMKILENELGFKINYFSYPKGRYSKEILSVFLQAQTPLRIRGLQIP